MHIPCVVYIQHLYNHLRNTMIMFQNVLVRTFHLQRNHSVTHHFVYVNRMNDALLVFKHSFGGSAFLLLVGGT